MLRIGCHNTFCLFLSVGNRMRKIRKPWMIMIIKPVIAYTFFCIKVRLLAHVWDPYSLSLMSWLIE